MLRFWLIVLGVLAGTGIALAQTGPETGPETGPGAVDLATVDACIDGHAKAQTSPVACVDEAMAACLLAPSNAPAVATLCYLEGEKAWSAGIAARMTQVQATASEGVAAVAAITVKYDLLQARLQCDRMEELSKVAGSDPAEAVQLQKSRCTAKAAALAYVALYWRAQGLTP